MKKTKEEIRELAEFIAKVLEDKKAIDVQVMEISEKSSLADYFVICSGQSSTQVRALVSEVEEQVREKYQLDSHFSEGFQTKKWVLLDYIDIVVHVFLHQEREFYNLDRLWQKSKENRVPSQQEVVE